ncbi:DNA-directed RNA polymerase subunit [Quillaja saponaria]|uniref:DNA-directed RNA polymerase subunit n=1 Tax=Quillaja saponaria TaxID=32244 RepID=A0AAD7PKH3_QUISA|nr:DNA-directed RNA polymerase subunit [Quillaja saponaria]
MAAPLLHVGVQFLRFRLQHNQRFNGGLISTPRQLWRRASKPTESAQPEENVTSAANTTSLLRTEDPPKISKWDDPYRKWKDKEDVILGDIDPIVLLTKGILHSQRYMDGERLTVEDEEAIFEKLLAYHPHSEDKIGCGLDSIMVDRHPQFRFSRCLLVLRLDDGWIDFSYKSALEHIFEISTHLMQKDLFDSILKVEVVDVCYPVTY